MKPDANATPKTAEIPPYNPAVMDPAAFDNIASVEYGGQHPILNIEVGDVAGPLTYEGHTSMTLNGKEVVVHLGSNAEAEMSRLPIAAAFCRAMDQAELGNGDTFAIKRLESVEKKAGLGKGNMMEIYSIKVISRKPATAAAKA